MNHHFTVWAPNAQTVELLVGNRLLKMNALADGHFSLDVDDVEPGARYGFVLDGSEPVPDPRSACQPDGVNGLSQLVDGSAFPWSDEHWQAPPLSSSLIYELHIGTFTPDGTFTAAIERLPYLRDLGVTHVELMPVAEFSGDYGWGYDGVDLFAPHRMYGGADGLKKLVDAAHAIGLAVLLDVVYNHLGPSGNYLSMFGPYFTSRHSTPWGEAVNLDGPCCHEVRRFLIDNALMWLRVYHIDGLRLDAVHALIDNGATHFLEQLSLEVEQLSIELGKQFVLIAESDLNDPRIVRSREVGGFGIDAQWSDDFHHALHTVLTGESKSYYSDYGKIAHLGKCWKEVFVHNGTYSPYRKRPHGRHVGDLPAQKFLAYIQNHDQIGNRASGERIGHLVSRQLTKVAAGMVLTSPFLPMLFMGEEWGASSPFQYFTRHEDEKLGHAVSEGRRSEFVDFGWGHDDVPDPQEPATFERSKLRWEELEEAPHAEMLNWYQTLIAFRRSHPALTTTPIAETSVACSEEGRWIAIGRGNLTVLANFSAQGSKIPVAENSQLLLASGADVRLEDGGVWLGPETFAVTGIQRG